MKKEEQKQKTFQRKLHSVSSAVAVETPAHLSKILNSSLLPLLTSIPTFLYIPFCFDALETARFTRWLLCFSPIPLAAYKLFHSLEKYLEKLRELQNTCAYRKKLKTKHQRGEEIALKGFLRSCDHRKYD